MVPSLVVMVIKMIMVVMVVVIMMVGSKEEDVGRQHGA